MAITINGSTGISGVNGSAAAPAIVGGDSDTGIFFGTDEAAITTGGTQRLSIDSTSASFAGNVSAVDGTLTGNLAVTGDAQMASLNNGQLAGRRNRIGNGSFQISQRELSGNNATIYNGRPRIADMWTIRGHIDTGATIDWEIADGVAGRTRSTICDNTYANAFRFQFTSAVTDIWGIVQFIEPPEAKSFNGKTMTISFVSSIDHTNYSIYLQASGDSAHFFSLSSTTTNPYGSTGYVVSGSVSIPADTFDDGDSTIGLYFYNTTDMSSGDEVDISLIQLEEGSVHTPYEFRTYADDLALCQRYLYVMQAPQTFTRFGIGVANSNVEAQAIIHFPVTMRIPPTALEGAASGLYQASDGSTGYTGTNLTLTGNVRSHDTACISLATTGLTSKNTYYVEANGNVTGTKYLRFSAEL